MEYDFTKPRSPRARALIPFLVFLVFYFGASLATGDFYRVPMPVAFLVASATALFLNHKRPLKERVELFTRGMGEPDIMAMCLIFILAGAFANTARAMGAVDGTVQLALSFIPPGLLPAGLFLVACFISLAIGTSVGTVLALTPIALGLTQGFELSVPLCLGIVVGGAMFGDNLSMISDTTIAATRTQGVEMHTKFYANLRIVIPAAVLTIAVYLFAGRNITASTVAAGNAGLENWIKVLPYLAVLALALLRWNVMLVLMAGTLVAAFIGLVSGAFDFWSMLDAMGKGVFSMSETLIVALLAGGLLKVVRYNGGIEYLLARIESRIHGRRGGEFGIALLVMAVNLFTANNTVAIVISGPVARDVSRRYKVPPERSASILDTASCVIQGVIPYGAQVLSAIGLAGVGAVNSLDVLKSLYYPYLLGVCMFAVILLPSGIRGALRCR